ncbi:unnamed protein product [Chrysoparadoxa australica]
MSPKAFHAAARDGNVELVQSFLQGQAAVDLRDSGGATPLFTAPTHGHEACVRVLLDGGADISEGGFNALYLACEEGHTVCAAALLDAGADINCPQESGWTALMAAAKEGHFDALQLLLQRGADVHQKDGSEESGALYFACYESHTACAAALLDVGADVNDPMEDGWTALMNAACRGHLDML